MPADKSIVITITVLPFAKGKRRLIVSGAPQGEMPVVHTGEFAQVHQLINSAWAELVRRKPQVPKVKRIPSEATAAGGATVGETVAPVTTAAAAAGDAPQGDQLVASGADLPVIEDAAPAGDAPALTSLDETEEDTND